MSPKMSITLICSKCPGLQTMKETSRNDSYKPEKMTLDGRTGLYKTVVIRAVCPMCKSFKQERLLFAVREYGGQED